MTSGSAPLPWPASPDLGALWHVRGDDLRARDALVRHYMPYARMQAARLYGGRFGDELGFDDYFQIASLALTEAVDRFDPSRDIKFETFAAYRIRGAVLDGVASMSERQRQIAVTRELKQSRLQALLRAGEEPAADGEAAAPVRRGLFEPGSALDKLADLGLGMAIGFLLEGTGLIDPGLDAAAPAAQSPYARVEMRQQRERLLRMVERLPEMQRRVLQWHYLQGQPFDALAARLELSKGRISQLHSAALATLRRSFEADG